MVDISIPYAVSISLDGGKTTVQVGGNFTLRLHLDVGPVQSQEGEPLDITALRRANPRLAGEPPRFTPEGGIDNS